MPDVSFRFYAQLNDFLAKPRRGCRFSHTVAGPASVKDAIEGIGVPHPEVDLILVNGRSEPFTYRLRDGDDIAVYPRFRTVDVSGLERVGVDPPQVARFTADVHLGRLAALLRLCGFDTLLATEGDAAAGALAADERIVLTRDIGSLKRRVVRHGYWVRETAPERQLVEVLDRFDLTRSMHPFERCTRCNTLLVAVPPSAVADELPPRTREDFDEFQRCAGCGRVYWKGSHYERLAALMARIRAASSTPAR
jgi:uncharacterized protein